MRTLTSALAVVMLTIGLAAPAAAHPRVPLSPPLEVDLTHAASDNVGFVERFHEHFGAAGGIVTSNDWNDGQDFFVVTDPRGVYTYDVSDPEHPVQLDFLIVNQGDEDGEPGVFAQEDPSTDGYRLLVDGINEAGGIGLQIVSIEDPTSLSILGTYDGLDHTWTCVSDVTADNGCTHAYGRSNNIIDIRDPANPVEVNPGWKAALGFGTGNGGGDYAHDLTEIRPGLVMSAGAQPALMDTTDPANPVLLSRITLWDHDSPYDDHYQVGPRDFDAFGYHSVEWAQDGHDAFLVMGTELASQNSPVPTRLVGYGIGDDCNGEDQAVIETWDARPVLAAFDEMADLEAQGASHADARTAAFGDGTEVKFVRLDTYAASGAGTFIDGKAVGSVLFCAHWMEPERDFADGGRIVAGYYNRGARFIDVAPVGATDEDDNAIEGTMSEIGWFTGADAYTGSAQWISDEVVYVMDYVRGMDVIKITDQEATGYYTATGSVSDRAMTIAQMEELGIAPPPAEDGVPHGVLTVAGLALIGVVALRRRRATARA